MPENEPSRFLIACEGETGCAKWQDDIFPPKKPVSVSTTMTSVAAPSSTECEKVPVILKAAPVVQQAPTPVAVPAKPLSSVKGTGAVAPETKAVPVTALIPEKPPEGPLNQLVSAAPALDKGEE